jgi:outer membrane receptor protein involved in Fe transport
MRVLVPIFLLLTTSALAAELTKPPRLLRGSEAIYPDRALAERVEAEVILELDVTEEGRVRDVTAVRTSTRTPGTTSTATATAAIDRWGFTRAATTAAARLEFAPGESEGVAVPVRIRWKYDFVLPPEVFATQTSTAPPPPAPARLAGTVRQRGNRMRLEGITVVARREQPTAESYETFTDREGHFTLDLPPGEWNIEAQATGFFPLRATEKLEPGQLVEVAYSIERTSGSQYEVIVRAEAPRREVDRRTLSAKELVRVPGTLGDPIQAVENMPGVARIPFGIGGLLVRGSGPQDSAVFVEGIYVPLIYHFGGLRSVVPGDVLDRIDFYPGNFSAQYGRVTGGILDARLKKVAPDQIHGALDVSLLDAGLFLEVPLGEKAAVLVAGRRSYIDQVLKAAIPDDSSVSLVAAPRYYDYQLLLDWRPINAHELRLFLLGSDDELGLLFEEPADLDSQIRSGSLNAHTAFQRLCLTHRWTLASELRNELRVSIGRDLIESSFFDQFRFDLNNRELQIRDLAVWTVSPVIKIEAGLDLLFQVVDVNVLAPRPPREGDVMGNPDLTDVLATSIDDARYFQVAPFVEAELKVTDDLTLIPGARVDWFSEVEEVSFDPRLVARWRVAPDWTAKGGIGLVHQPPTPQETDEIFGNPELGLQRAVHLSAGAEWTPEPHLSFDGTLFYKALDQLVSSTGALVERNGELAPMVYDNGATGRVYGLELWIQHKLSNNFRGWLTYTLSRAERTDSGESSARLFDFDQTHIFSVIAAWMFPENWELSGRFRLVSGNPWTPFNRAVFASDLDRYVPIPGEHNSSRLPMFHQLDVRLEKRWIYESWSLAAYVSLTNAYNRKNVEGLRYNFDFTQSTPIQGLPIFPILGIRGEL